MMKTVFIVSIIILFVTPSVCSQDNQAILKNALADLKAAIEASDGVKASKYVDRATKDYFGRILFIVKRADSTRLLALPLREILAATFVRHTYSRESILMMDTTALMHAELSNGLIKALNVRHLNIESAIMNYESKRFSARISQTYLDRLHLGRAFYLDFAQEENMFKINLPSVMNYAEAILNGKPELKTLGLSLFVEQLLEKMTARPVSANIWKPVK